MSKPYIHIQEALARKVPGKMSFELLGEENGCLSGCRSGITVNDSEEYGTAGVHEDQEGFFVLEGEGYVMLDDMEIEVCEGSSFIALPGVKHTMRTKDKNKPLKIFWFHSAV